MASFENCEVINGNGTSTEIGKETYWDRECIWTQKEFVVKRKSQKRSLKWTQFEERQSDKTKTINERQKEKEISRETHN
jgi:hypothetical protein